MKIVIILFSVSYWIVEVRMSSELYRPRQRRFAPENSGVFHSAEYSSGRLVSILLSSLLGPLGEPLENILQHSSAVVGDRCKVAR